MGKGREVRVRRRTPRSGIKTAVRISVVVPTYRRPDALRACLSAIRAQDFADPSYEVVVVDHAGDPATRAGVDAYTSGPTVRSTAAPARRGPASARNLGAEAAQGEFLAFIDADCEPDAGWLTALDRAITDAGSSPRVIFGGGVVNG